MNESQARDVIYKQFATDWGSTTAIAYQNINYTPPNDGSPWVRLNVIHITSTQASLGGVGDRRFRRRGVVVVQVFTKDGDATYNNDTYADKARGIFEGKKLSGVTFQNVGVETIGSDGFGWYQQNVRAEFWYDAIL